MAAYRSSSSAAIALETSSAILVSPKQSALGIVAKAVMIAAHRRLLPFRSCPQGLPLRGPHRVQDMIFPSGPHIEADRGWARIDRSYLRDRLRFLISERVHKFSRGAASRGAATGRWIVPMPPSSRGELKESLQDRPRRGGDGRRCFQLLQVRPAG
jgi:hypothetical protein